MARSVALISDFQSQPFVFCAELCNFAPIVVAVTLMVFGVGPIYIIRYKDMTTRTIAVLGMMCAGCAGTVERTLSRMEGVTTASVNLAARTVTVTYDERLTSPQAMKERLAQAGYDLVIEQDRNVEAIERRQYQRLRRKVAVAWLLSLLCMAIGMGWIETGSADAANQLSMLIALTAMVWCGRDIYRSAWRQTLHATANMDTLVAHPINHGDNSLVL